MATLQGVLLLALLLFAGELQHGESRRLLQFPALPGQPLPLPTDPTIPLIPSTGLNPPRWSLPVPILPFPPLPPVPQLPAFPGFPPIPFFKPWKMLLLHFLLNYMFSFGEFSMTFFKESSTVRVFFEHSLIFCDFYSFKTLNLNFTATNRKE